MSKKNNGGCFCLVLIIIAAALEYAFPQIPGVAWFGIIIGVIIVGVIVWIVVYNNSSNKLYASKKNNAYFRESNPIPNKITNPNISIRNHEKEANVKIFENTQKFTMSSRSSSGKNSEIKNSELVQFSLNHLYCPRCGSANPENNTFCNSCNSKLT
jgi:uncharacterized membrane protein YvbJ